MTARKLPARVIPLRKPGERRSEAHELLGDSRVDRLRREIRSGEFVIDPDRIADHVIDDIKSRGDN